MKPLRIAPQPRRQSFELPKKAAAFVEFPAMLAETVTQDTHSAAPAALLRGPPFGSGQSAHRAGGR